LPIAASFGVGARSGLTLETKIYEGRFVEAVQKEMGKIRQESTGRTLKIGRLMYSRLTSQGRATVRLADARGQGVGVIGGEMIDEGVRLAA